MATSDSMIKALAGFATATMYGGSGSLITPAPKPVTFQVAPVVPEHVDETASDTCNM